MKVLFARKHFSTVFEALIAAHTFQIVFGNIIKAAGLKSYSGESWRQPGCRKSGP